MSKNIEKALTQYGIREIRGVRDNPKVLKYFNDLGFDGARLKDETAWCSAFANWVCKKTGSAYSGKLNARSWISVGRRVTAPNLGILLFCGAKIQIVGKDMSVFLFDRVEITYMFWEETKTIK